jgi:glycosyltransferase involved in cell wall biosynthesis
MKKKIDISIIGLRSFPASFSGTSGIEFFVESTLQHLHFKDFVFRIYTRRKYSSLHPQIRNVQVQVTPLRTLQAKNLETIVYSFFASLHAMKDSSKIIWYHGVGSAFFAWLPKLMGKKIVLTVHSLDWERKKWSKVEKYFFRSLVMLSLKSADQIYVVSSELKAYFQEKYTLKSSVTFPGMTSPHKKSIQVNPTLKKFHLRKNNYLFYIGRFVPEKRIEWLIEGFKKIKKTFPTLELVLVGGHGNIASYEKELKEKYQQNDIHWLGYLFGAEKNVLIQQARAYISASELEGNSLALVEAISEGQQSLISNSCCPKELQSLSFLYLFQTKSFHSFVRELKKILGQTKKITTEDKRHLQEVQKQYHWNVTAKKYADSFKMLVGK